MFLHDHHEAAGFGLGKIVLCLAALAAAAVAVYHARTIVVFVRVFAQELLAEARKAGRTAGAEA